MIPEPDPTSPPLPDPARRGAIRPGRAMRERRRRRRLRLARLVAGVAAAVTAIAVGVAPIAADRATAADWGPGFSDADNGGLGWLGAFRVGGTTLYCLESAQPFALGATSGPEYGGWAGLDADTLARLHWAIAHGQTDSPVVAAAVQLYVWSVADPGGFASHGMAGEDWYLPRVPDAYRGAVEAELAGIRAAVAGVTASPAVGGGSMRLVIDPVDATLGTLVVGALAPSTAVGTVTLTGAVGAATGSPTIAGVTAGATIPIVGIPPADGAPYRVSAVGDFTASAGNAGELGIFRTAGAQTLAGPGREAPVAFRLEAADDEDRTSTFRPVVATAAPAVRFEAGERFADVLTFGIAADETGRTNRWYRDQEGTPLTITATCRVFGPFADPPLPAAAPPRAAPVAAVFTVTTSGDGPEAVYPARSEQPLDDPGYYTATCSIDAGSQLPSARAFLPEGYRFQDGFGLVPETAVVPFRPAISTELVPSSVGLGADVVDRVTVALAAGPWLSEADGSPAEVELLGRFTFVTSAPVRAAEAPADAVLLAERRIVATEEGTVAAEPVAVPREAGWVVAQWCVVERDLVVASCDDWAAPGEVAVVVPPTVTTRADAAAQPGGSVRDTAIIDGPVPAGGLRLEFRGYLQPPNADAPTCTEETLAFASSAPVLATASGAWPSEPFAVGSEHLGTVFWVERATAADGELIAEGECGRAEETTTVAIPRALALTGAPVGLVGGIGGTSGLAVALALVGAGLIASAARRGGRGRRG